LASFTTSRWRPINVFWGPPFWKNEDSDWKKFDLPLEDSDYVPGGAAFPGCMLATKIVAAVKIKMSFMLEDWKSKIKFLSESNNF